MPWTCRLLLEKDVRAGYRPRPGDLWFWKAFPRNLLSPYYLAHNSWRPPVIVHLPGTAGAWCLDGFALKEGLPCGDGWEVSGEPPALTVLPSINIPGRYHGWLKDGVLSDDVEGRTFPAERT